MLEVHFRLDDTSPDCPDYPVALSPAELTEYIRLARLAHTMRGDGVKRPQPSELANMKHRVTG
jgi:sialic acid synthase SpsE